MACHCRLEAHDVRLLLSLLLVTPMATRSPTHPLRSMAITISSREALPARSPMPLMVHSTWRAPSAAPARLLAVASPRSFWQWVETTTPLAPGVLAITSEMRLPNSCGRAHPATNTDMQYEQQGHSQEWVQSCRMELPNLLGKGTRGNNDGLKLAPGRKLLLTGSKQAEELCSDCCNRTLSARDKTWQTLPKCCCREVGQWAA